MALGIWLAAEICAFILVVSVLGAGGAVLLGLLTSVIGFSQLRRLGQGAASSLRRVFGPRGVVLKQDSVVDGTIAAIGGVLLILPGFLSDLIGLALSAPSVRLWIVDHMKWVKPVSRRKAKPRRERIIDLDDQEWRRIDEAKPDLRRGV